MTQFEHISQYQSVFAFTLQDLQALMKTYNISIMIIYYTKIIEIKQFCIFKKIEIETLWQINKPSNIFFFRFTFCTYIYIYIYILLRLEKKNI